MKVKVYMLAFGKPDEVREVDVPGPATLDAVFYYGQNDFQPQQHPSVSMGDVIELNGKLFVIQAVGFKEITKEQLKNYKKLERIDRQFSELVIN
jgi:hypothetical protein